MSNTHNFVDPESIETLTHKDTPINEGDKRSSFRWFIVVLLFIIIMVNFIDRSAMSFTLAHLRLEFHLSNAQLGLILGGFGIGFAVSIFFGGILADKFGPRTIFAIAMLIWALSMFSMSASIGFTTLFLSRLLLGAGEGPTFPCTDRAIADWMPINQRVTALTYIYIAPSVALVIAAPIITNIIWWFDWRGMFIGLAILSLIWIPIWLYYFRNKPCESNRVTQDELAIISNRKGNFLIRENKDNIPKNMWHYMLMTPTYKTETILAKDRPLPKNHWKFLLTNKTLLSNYWGCFVYGAFLYLFMGWLPSYFSEVYNLSLRDNGWFNMITWGVPIIFMIINGRLSDYIMKKTGKFRYSRTYPVIVGSFFASLSILPLVIVDHPSLFLATACISLGIAFGLGPSANYVATAMDLAKRRTGSILGINGVALSLAGIIVPALTGYFIDLTGNFKMGFLLLVILGLSAVIIISIFHHPDDPLTNDPNEIDEALEHPYYDYLQNLENRSKKGKATQQKKAIKRAKKLGLKVINK
ncbi:MFS transporter [Rickettsiales bacterium LUAb2]